MSKCNFNVNNHYFSKSAVFFIDWKRQKRDCKNNKKNIKSFFRYLHDETEINFTETC